MTKLKWTTLDHTEPSRFWLQTEQERDGNSYTTWVTLMIEWYSDQLTYERHPEWDKCSHGRGAKARMRKLAQQIADANP